MNLTFDIETIPSLDHPPEPINRDDIAAAVTHPARLSKQESIDKWYQEQYQTAVSEAYQKAQDDSEAKWEKGSLYSLEGKVICIAWAFGNGPVQCLHGSDEHDLLKRWSDLILPQANEISNTEQIYWIGHNIHRFDLPFLANRFMINRLKCSIHLPWDSKPWDDTIVDTINKIPFTGGEGKSLDRICKVLGLGEKLGSGADVYGWFEEGDWEAIANHCKRDVELERKLCKFFMLGDPKHHG